MKVKWKRWRREVLCFSERSLCLQLVVLVKLSLRENKSKTIMEMISRPFPINKQFYDLCFLVFAWVLWPLRCNRCQKSSCGWDMHNSPLLWNRVLEKRSALHEMIRFAPSTSLANLLTFERTCIFVMSVSLRNTEISQSLKNIGNR